MKIEEGLPNTLLHEKLFKNQAKDDFSKYYTYIYAGILFLVYEKRRIFYRMRPKDKVDLVNFYKEDQVSIMAMFGDGANDCGALLSSEVVITVNQEHSGNSVTSHFYSTDESISCIEHILKNGRACFENSVVIFKYMILNGIIQINSVMSKNSLTL
jgi:P-type E1-E2 ATPase